MKKILVVCLIGMAVLTGMYSGHVMVKNGATPQQTATFAAKQAMWDMPIVGNFAYLMSHKCTIGDNMFTGQLLSKWSYND